MNIQFSLRQFLSNFFRLLIPAFFLLATFTVQAVAFVVDRRRACRGALVAVVFLFGTGALAQQPQPSMQERLQADPSTRQMALRDLVRRGKAVAPEVAPLLTHPNSDVRSAALAVLERVEATGVLDQVAARLFDAAPSVRAAAAKTLGALKDERAVLALMTAPGAADPLVRGRG